MGKKGETKELNSKMRDILRFMHRKGGAVTANEIKDETGISYVTIKKYLGEMLKLGVIVEIKNG